MLRFVLMFLWVHAKCLLLYSCVWMGVWWDGWYFTIFRFCFTIFMFCLYWFFCINVRVLTMFAASIDGFLLFYELTLILCFSCLILILFVANKFLSFFFTRNICRHWARLQYCKVDSQWQTDLLTIFEQMLVAKLNSNLMWLLARDMFIVN